MLFTTPVARGSIPGGSVGKESACNAGDPDSILGSGRSPGAGAPQCPPLHHREGCVLSLGQEEAYRLCPPILAKTRPGADCGSDHELLIAKFRLKLKKVGKTTRPFMKSWDRRVRPHLVWRNRTPLAYRVVHGVTFHLSSCV